LAYFVDMNDLARTPRQIGTIIQRARKKRGWTQTQLAERAGLRQATISIIESGEKPAKLDSILAVLAAIDLEFRVGERSKGAGQDIEELF
jgi:HTH-type transcriptional regulator/antitoxin HipB